MYMSYVVSWHFTFYALILYCSIDWLSPVYKVFESLGSESEFKSTESESESSRFKTESAEFKSFVLESECKWTSVQLEYTVGL